MAKTEVLGIGELKASFSEVQDAMKTRIARYMVVGAGQVIKKKAKEIAQANGSVRTGAMVRNIVIKRETQAPSDTAQYHLAVRSGGALTKKQKSTSKLAINAGGRIVRKYENDPYYWRWVERGHKIVAKADKGEASFKSQTIIRRTKKGKVIVRSKLVATNSLRERRKVSTGEVSAKPFLQPALEQCRAEAIAAMETNLQKELAKASKA